MATTDGILTDAPPDGGAGMSSTRLTGSPAVGRVVRILDALADADRPVGVSEIARTTGLAKSTVHALLGSLAETGLVERRSGGVTFALGSRVLTWAQRYLDGDALVGRFTENARVFAERTGQTVQLARLDGIEVVYLAKVDGPNPIGLASRTGSRLPASTTALGKAMLAQLAETEIRRRYDGAALPRLTAGSITELAVLLRQVRAIREGAPAEDREESRLGIVCHALPLLTIDGTPHAISTSQLASALRTPEEDARVLGELTRLRDRLAGGRWGDRT